ncbi:MAG: hypothetical protein ACO3HD_06965 [Burkholderiaceae bacterium]
MRLDDTVEDQLPIFIGLGLSIAHRAALVMGGSLRLLRSGETGSTFVCSVPVSPCHPG